MIENTANRDFPNDNDHKYALPPGYRLQEYRIEAVLGAGGFGITYRAQDLNLNKAVVLKEFLPQELALRDKDLTVVVKSNRDAAFYQWGLERFLAEAQTLAKFKHPNIVQVFRFFSANGTAYFVMDYEAGESLRDYVGRLGRPLTEQEALAWFLPVIDGLRAVHRAGFLHRDIKPENIFLRADGSPMLLDFGSARFAIGEKSHSIHVVVSAGFASFEQYSSQGKLGPWTDIYSLGASLYWAITGQIPPEATDRSITINDGEPDPYRPVAGWLGKRGYSPAFLDAIDRAMAFRAKDRPQTIKEFLACLAKKAERKTNKPSNEDDSTNDERRYPSLKAAMLYIAIGLLGLSMAAVVVKKSPLYAIPDIEMVDLPTGIRFAKTEVTQQQWRTVMGYNPSRFTDCGARCPVETVSWEDIQLFIARLNARTGRRFRLPTEGEWYAACRGDDEGEVYCGSNDIDAVAWFEENSQRQTQPAGSKKANASGIFDMSGNVWEWTDSCIDESCRHRIVRGGSWASQPAFVVSDARSAIAPNLRANNLGFRLVEEP